MDSRWFSNLPKNEQEEFKKLVLGSHKVLDRAAEICYNKVKSGVTPPKADYDSPSWAYKQADANGYIRAYQELYDFLNISDKESK